jgi:hypothetical protein
MGVALLLVVVVVAMVGLPLAAVVWSKASHVGRPAEQSWTDVLHAEARRRHLSSVQIAEVTQAVNRGVTSTRRAAGHYRVGGSREG